MPYLTDYPNCRFGRNREIALLRIFQRRRIRNRGWRRIACNHPVQSLLRMESSPLPPGHATHLSSATRHFRLSYSSSVTMYGIAVSAFCDSGE
jgi:hypothetical protein